MTAHEGEIPLRGLPGVPEGLVAYAITRSDGSTATDAKGRPNIRRVCVCREPSSQIAVRPAGLLSDPQWRYAVGTERRWTSVLSTFGDNAMSTALALARAGCVHLIHEFRNGTVQQPPRGWKPDPLHSSQVSAQRQDRKEAKGQLQNEAADLARDLAHDWPGVAGALTAAENEARLWWLIVAAKDLADGVMHASVRAFVQHHARNTKARDDLARMLLDSGFEAGALSELGISRSPYVGIGGRVLLRHGAAVMDCSVLPGPHDVRLRPGAAVSISLVDSGPMLLVIENRQAAEAICDRYAEVPVIWCHGQPPAAVLEIVRQAAKQSKTVFICPDADLGGIRIAARILDSLPPGGDYQIVDIGAADHPKGRTFSSHTIVQIGAYLQRNDAVAQYARSCLNRGYAIEQEAPVRHAIDKLLSAPDRT